MTDRERVRILRAALREAALHFRAYEALHTENLELRDFLTQDAEQDIRRKIKANRDRAIACERALQDTV